MKTMTIIQGMLRNDEEGLDPLNYTMLHAHGNKLPAVFSLCRICSCGYDPTIIYLKREPCPEPKIF
jgi:hypothetical protein